MRIIAAKITVLSAFLFAFVSPVMAISSQAVREKITEQIEADREFGAHDLTITSRRDSVVLDGMVSSERDKRAVELYARTAAKTHEIENNLQVGYVPNQGGDTGLAKEVRDAIVNAKKARNYTLQVHQTGSRIRLEGIVATDADRAWMEKVARETREVKSVENALQVRPPPSDSKIVSDVRAAMRQSGEFIPQDLEVASTQGVVEIKGNFPDHRTVDQALALTIMVPGVKEIRSAVRVNGGPYPTEYRTEDRG